MSDNFSQWLIEELNIRTWTQAELARQAGVSRTAISDVIAEKHEAGFELCLAIAHALKVSPIFVLRKGGLLPQVPEETEKTEELFHLFSKLPPGEQQEMLELLRFKVERKPANINEKPPSRKKNPARSVLNN